MAITKSVRILTIAIADGESTQFTLDLASDPYWVGEGMTSGLRGAVANFGNSTKPPVGVAVVDGADAAAMAVTASPTEGAPPAMTVVIDVPIRTAGERYEVVLDILFD